MVLRRVGPSLGIKESCINEVHDSENALCLPLLEKLLLPYVVSFYPPVFTIYSIGKSLNLEKLFCQARVSEVSTQKSDNGQGKSELVRQHGFSLDA